LEDLGLYTGIDAPGATPSTRKSRISSRVDVLSTIEAHGDHGPVHPDDRPPRPEVSRPRCRDPERPDHRTPTGPWD